jgi:hypothetical protein
VLFSEMGKLNHSSRRFNYRRNKDIGVDDYFHGHCGRCQFLPQYLHQEWWNNAVIIEHGA